MPQIPITLIKGDKIEIETDYRDALCVNMIAIERPILGAGGYMRYYPGLLQLGEGIGIDRGANYNERFSDHYRISGNKLISVDKFGSVTEIGTIPGSKQCRIKGLYSFNTQGVIADGKFFLYSPSGGFREVTDPDLGRPLDGVWVDSYYFMTDGEYIFHTDLNDEFSIDPLKYATAEFMPDPSIGIGKTQDNKVIVFGRYTTEYFVNVAQSNFAFQRVPSRAQKIGIVSTHAKCEVGGQYYFVGGYKNESIGVYLLGIGASQKVSSREVDKIIAQYSEPELLDIRLESRSEQNKVFVILHLPNETLCFMPDLVSKFGMNNAWSILKTGTGNNTYRAINGIFDARIAKWIYGDKRSSNIGELSESICTQYGEIAEWILYTPVVNLESMSIDAIEIESIPGHTSTRDATVAVSKTYDGLTYSQEWWKLYGYPHDYHERFILRRLGYVRDWVGFKFRGVSKSPMAFGLLKLTYS